MNLPTFVEHDVYEMALGPSTTEHKVVELKCPRKACGEIFILRINGIGRTDSLSRPCPYCFRTSLLPEDRQRAVKIRAKQRANKK